MLADNLTWPSGHVAWTNFWRDTEPLGWRVSAGERDVPVTDPEALHPSGGEVADPPIRNHSGYPDALEFHRERAVVARLLRRGVPSPGSVDRITRSARSAVPATSAAFASSLP